MQDIGRSCLINLFSMYILIRRGTCTWNKTTTPFWKISHILIFAKWWRTDDKLKVFKGNKIIKLKRPSTHWSHRFDIADLPLPDNIRTLSQWLNALIMTLPKDWSHNTQSWWGIFTVGEEGVGGGAYSSNPSSNTCLRFENKVRVVKFYIWIVM